jgi:hypothetical protein
MPHDIQAGGRAGGRSHLGLGSANPTKEIHSGTCEGVDAGEYLSLLIFTKSR